MSQSKRKQQRKKKKQTVANNRLRVITMVFFFFFSQQHNFTNRSHPTIRHKTLRVKQRTEQQHFRASYFSWWAQWLQLLAMEPIQQRFTQLHKMFFSSSQLGFCRFSSCPKCDGKLLTLQKPNCQQPLPHLTEAAVF